MAYSPGNHINGALLIDKPADITSFGVIDRLRRTLGNQLGTKSRKQTPKMGHGGTLDPFATGLLIVLVGRASKLARYFLGSDKTYQGEICFGESNIAGDPTEDVLERCDFVPDGIESIQKAAHDFTLAPYMQIPPMHSAKKINGRPLYELARQGKVVDREPKLCILKNFTIDSYELPRARFTLECTSGTYVRTLAQDLAKKMGSLGLLSELKRTAIGKYSIVNSISLEEAEKKMNEGICPSSLPCWIPFDRVLDQFERIDATLAEAQALKAGIQNVLPNLLRRTPVNNSQPGIYRTIYHEDRLVAVARNEQTHWLLERVFS